MFSALLPVDLCFHLAIVMAKVEVSVPSCAALTWAPQPGADGPGPLGAAGAWGSAGAAGAVRWGRWVVKPFSIEGAP